MVGDFSEIIVGIRANVISRSTDATPPDGGGISDGIDRGQD